MNRKKWLADLKDGDDVVVEDTAPDSKVRFQFAKVTRDGGRLGVRFASGEGAIFRADGSPTFNVRGSLRLMPADLPEAATFRGRDAASAAVHTSMTRLSLSPLHGAPQVATLVEIVAVARALGLLLRDLADRGPEGVDNALTIYAEELDDTAAGIEDAARSLE